MCVYKLCIIQLDFCIEWVMHNISFLAQNAKDKVRLKKNWVLSSFLFPLSTKTLGCA